MGLDADDVARLDERAKAVGANIGWDLSFIVAPNPEYVGLTACPAHVFVVGPSPLAELAAYDVELELDRLERGTSVLEPDEDGDPRLFHVRES